MHTIYVCLYVDLSLDYLEFKREEAEAIYMNILIVYWRLTKVCIVPLSCVISKSFPIVPIVSAVGGKQLQHLAQPSLGFFAYISMTSEQHYSSQTSLLFADITEMKCYKLNSTRLKSVCDFSYKTALQKKKKKKIRTYSDSLFSVLKSLLHWHSFKKGSLISSPVYRKNFLCFFPTLEALL